MVCLGKESSFPYGQIALSMYGIANRDYVINKVPMVILGFGNRTVGWFEAPSVDYLYFVFTINFSERWVGNHHVAGMQVVMLEAISLQSGQSRGKRGNIAHHE